MFRLLMTCFAAATLLVSLSFAHDERLHKANALTGEIVSVTADGLQLKTKTDTVTVKFSSKTKFELDTKAVDKSQVRQGDRAGVIGNKLPTGAVMANEVILGLPAPGATAGADTKKAADPKD
jgi:hypothetical protein